MAEGFISDEDIRRVREASDIVSIVGGASPVKQRGRDFWCCCPLHNERRARRLRSTPRFSCGTASDAAKAVTCSPSS